MVDCKHGIDTEKRYCRKCGDLTTELEWQSKRVFELGEQVLKLIAELAESNEKIRNLEHTITTLQAGIRKENK